jgi:hypothetical protein
MQLRDLGIKKTEERETKQIPGKGKIVCGAEQVG